MAKARYTHMEEPEGKVRVIIERVKPEIDSGQFPIKRGISEKVVVEVDIFADGKVPSW